MSNKSIQYVNENSERHEQELIEILKVPSVSSDPERKADLLVMAEQLKEEMIKIGLENTQIIPTAGHPSVYAEWLGAPGKPTLLIYGHYDVQPVDPVDLWDSPPFEPVIKNGKIFARGSADDKGQIFIHLKAIEAVLAAEKELPVNVKLIFEGEEEVGSEHLTDLIKEHAELLSCDYVIISDTPMFREGFPGITYGLRGLTYLQVDIRGTDTDLHSGTFGGLVKNPIHALVDILAKMKDEDGKILIPGFYDDVLPISENEHDKLSKLPFDPKAFADGIGAPTLYGEAGFDHLERLWARPTFDVNGIWGGFQGEGAKTVIPAEAHAKVSMRLVANQDPDDIAEKFTAYAQSLAPDTVDIKVRNMHGGFGYLTDLENPGLLAGVRALEKAFGKEVDFIREGGSIPIVKVFADILKAPVLLMGYGLPDQNAHAPNENFSLYNFHKGIESIVYFLDEMGQL
ncbi:MAG: dipeptidase [Candidatus Marinimicrobia bacterium]|nr:dipeptidase [Candidatus Neomarinimicrobiota bacterium]MCF7904538.1 dipeptidase [Candidatus Neomarinimicrobiota bacterium]